MTQTLRKYQLTFARFKSKFVVSYKNDNFKSLEYKSGGFPPALKKSIGQAFPKYETEIKNFPLAIQNKVFFTLLDGQKKVEKESDFKKYNRAWFQFYESNVGVTPRFNGADGKHLKEIIKYLQEVEQDPERAFNLWQVILSHWQKLDKFYQENKDLPFINSQLNKIIQNVQRISHKATNDPFDNIN